MDKSKKDFIKNANYKEELLKLLSILETFDMDEEFKWGKPCFTFNNNNVVLIHEFKEYIALLFHKGVLIKDTKNILVQQTENVHAARQLRFKNINEINEQEEIIKDYIKQAINIEKNNIELPLNDNYDNMVIEELEEEFKNNPKFKKGFNSLTKGRQNNYKLFFNSPKQSKTKINRIEKYRDKIEKGLGMYD